MAKFWIKLHHQILDDLKFGLLPEFEKWRAIELFLAAGENGEDGLLPPVERLAWRLRLPLAKLEETLSALSQAGVVHETPQGWVVTDFQKTQEAQTSTERSRSFRERNAPATKGFNQGNDPATKSFKNSNEVAVAASNSYSTSESDSESLEEERVHTQSAGAGGQAQPSEYPAQPGMPTTPAEAMEHADILVFTAATGRIPGFSQYRLVIESVRYLRAREKLDDRALAKYLLPYWLAWSARKRLDGHPYDPGSITWLTEWAMNKSFPPTGAQKTAETARPAGPSVAETRKMLAEKDEMLKKAVPPPAGVLAKIHSLKKQLEGSKNADPEKTGEERPAESGASAPDR